MAIGDLKAPPRAFIPAAALRWRSVRSSGPGGQNVNKVASKVELRVELAAIEGLGPGERRRLRTLAGSRLSTAGELILTSDRSRDRARNLADARARLRELLVRAQQLPAPRRPTAIPRGVHRRRLLAKRLRATVKQGRGRVRGDDAG